MPADTIFQACTVSSAMPCPRVLFPAASPSACCAQLPIPLKKSAESSIKYQTEHNRCR